FRVAHSFAPIGNDTLYSLFLDDDTNPFNGYIDIVSQEKTSTTTLDLDPAPYQSGSYNVIGFASDDFATLTGNPWDMSESSDILIQSGIGNSNFANGIFSGTTDVGGSFLSMNLNDTPIDTSKYRYLSIGVTQAVGGNARIRWYDTNGTELNTASFVAAAGAQVIQLDLASFGNWTGSLGELRYYVNNSAGESFSIDYISLRANGFVNALTAPTIVAAPGQLTVNDPPQLNIMQPDRQGGIDFAAAVLGDPWNMDSLNDIKQARHVDAALIYPNNFINGKQGDFYCATSIAGNDDPYQVHLSETSASSNQLDASRFKNVTWEYYINRNQDVVNGSVTRIIFKNEIRKNEFLNGDDTMNQLGSEPTAWSSFTQDMTKIRLEPLLHAGSEPSPIWDGLMNYFRIDVHEFSDAATDFCLNSVQVRSDDEANTQFAISYDVADSDDDDSDISVSFYYSAQEATTGGAAIVEGLSLADDTRVYLWDTSGIPDGTYWVYGVVSDGHNSIRKLAHRISINHSRAQDTTVPVLNVSSPADGADVYDTFRIKGYAIDDYQVALVEVHIDGSLMHVFEPSLFNKDARTAHPTFSDASQAGYDETFSIASLGLGAHDVEVKVYDTAGNLTSSTFTVNKQAGSTPAVEEPAPDNEESLTVPTSGDTNIKFTVRLSVKRRQLLFKVTNANRCNSIALYTSTSKDDLEAAYSSGILLGERSGISGRKLTVKAPKLKRYSEGPGHFAFVCDGSLHTIKTAQINKFGGRGQTKNFDTWAAKLGKKVAKGLKKAK
ncbi:MAG: hypothetical protein KDD62_05275, partial [Bdellovibrionales bacterium]|nr:hypothetical protein [Bdellovibrionales bacterium]